ncbi:hypothetical protein I6A93_17565 [Clostridioides difficile]|nr:hypothetical protein [Clostridioides difficile]
MKSDLYLCKSNKLYRDNEVLEKFVEDLSFLIDDYKFSLETISILCKINIEKLTNFYAGKGYILYEEMSLIESVLAPFLSAIDIAKHNYDVVIKSRESDKPLIFEN